MDDSIVWFWFEVLIGHFGFPFFSLQVDMGEIPDDFKFMSFPFTSSDNGSKTEPARANDRSTTVASSRHVSEEPKAKDVDIVAPKTQSGNTFESKGKGRGAASGQYPGKGKGYDKGKGSGLGKGKGGTRNQG